MQNHLLNDFIRKLTSVVGSSKILTNEKSTLFYRTGIRVGVGSACAVVFPQSLLQLWEVLELSINFDKIIIMQAANTGLTGGSTPDGENYDRDIVIIITTYLDKLVLINNGSQVISFPGTTLYQLEEKLKPLGRGPHSVIGSSCIGASVVGGVCNNSGGNLVNRGPAYTELSLFAKQNCEGKLELINHLGIDLGSSPKDILENLEAADFNTTDFNTSEKMASDREYQARVRDVKADTPSRFNADPRRLYESSGCAGKIAVFAVRLDTFPLPKEKKVFFVGTNNPNHFTRIRNKILSDFKYLPDMGEYMHRSYFDGADKYCKDTFLFIKYLGTQFLPVLLMIKRKIDLLASNFSFLPDNISDKALQLIANLLPDHLPNSIRQYRDRFEHYLIILASDESIQSTANLLSEEASTNNDLEYLQCKSDEGRDLLLHRYVAGYSPSRYMVLNTATSAGLLPLDVALPRNCNSWYQIFPKTILDQMDECFQMGHFFCMVFHWDFVVRKGSDINAVKDSILELLDKNNAKYPAEHNVGHLYKAEPSLTNFYKSLDPTNTFNVGIGKTSRKKYYK